MPAAYYYCQALCVPSGVYGHAKANYRQLLDLLFKRKRKEDNKTMSTSYPSPQDSNKLDMKKIFFRDLVCFHKFVLCDSCAEISAASTLLNSLLGTLKSILSGSGISEALFIKIVVVGVFSILNSSRNFNNKDEPVFAEPEGVDKRTTNTSLAISMLLGVVNTVIKEDVMKQLARTGLAANRRPKQIRNFSSVVLVSEWMLSHRSRLFPPTPPCPPYKDSTTECAVAEEAVEIESNARRTFWSNVATLSNILSSPSCPDWVKADVEASSRNSRVNISREVKDLASFLPFQDIDRFRAAGDMIGRADHEKRTQARATMEEVANGSRVKIFLKFARQCCESSDPEEYTPLKMDTLGSFSINEEGEENENMMDVEDAASFAGSDGEGHYADEGAPAKTSLAHAEPSVNDHLKENDDDDEEDIVYKPSRSALGGDALVGKGQRQEQGSQFLANADPAVELPLKSSDKPLPKLPSPPPVQPSAPLLLPKDLDVPFHLEAVKPANTLGVPLLPLSFSLPHTSNPFFNPEEFKATCSDAMPSDDATGLNAENVMSTIQAVFDVDETLEMPTTKNPFWS